MAEAADQEIPNRCPKAALPQYTERMDDVRASQPSLPVPLQSQPKQGVISRDPSIQVTITYVVRDTYVRLLAAMDSLDSDVLVEILRRLPPNSRRRFRLVCRCWRNLVDERTTMDLRSRAKTLLVAQGGTSFVLGDDVEQSPRKVLANAEGLAISIIGTCNGLICFCDDSKGPGTIALANPATGEGIVLPSLPYTDMSTQHYPEDWHAAYAFAHHQTTGRYKVVHLPCYFDQVHGFDTLQVFTLGETAWRDVPTPAFGGAGARCRFDIGIVSVDGTVYWVAMGSGMIMSFDLEDEKFTTVKALPVEAIQPYWLRRRLTEVQGKLGMTIFHGSWNVEKIDVWVLESARGEQTWTLRYTMKFNVLRNLELLTHQLMLPHFTHGEHVLCVNDHDLVVYLPRRTSPGGVLEIGEKDIGTVIARNWYVHEAFTHVETKEPLSIYKLW